MAADDSDDDVQLKPATKTQKKKEERKVNLEAPKAPKINVGKMAEGGFDVVDKTRQPQG